MENTNGLVVVSGWQTNSDDVLSVVAEVQVGHAGNLQPQGGVESGASPQIPDLRRDGHFLFSFSLAENR